MIFTAARTSIVPEIDIRSAIPGDMNISHHVNICANSATTKNFPFPQSGFIYARHIAVTFMDNAGVVTDPGVTTVELWMHTNILAPTPQAWSHVLEKQAPGKYNLNLEYLGLSVSREDSNIGLTNLWVKCSNRGSVEKMTLVINYTTM